MSDREVNSKERKARLLRHAFEQTALASHAAKALGRSQPGVTRWLQLPWFHWH
jgi:transposase-like protein